MTLPRPCIRARPHYQALVDSRLAPAPPSRHGPPPVPTDLGGRGTRRTAGCPGAASREGVADRRPLLHEFPGGRTRTDRGLQACAPGSRLCRGPESRARVSIFRRERRSPAGAGHGARTVESRRHRDVRDAIDPDRPQATATIPIVMLTVLDPIGAGFVATLAHPGGNITGLSELSAELSAKRLALLKEAVPGISSLAVLVDQGHPTNALELKRRRPPHASSGSPSRRSTCRPAGDSRTCSPAWAAPAPMR